MIRHRADVLSARMLFSKQLTTSQLHHRNSRSCVFAEAARRPARFRASEPVKLIREKRMLLGLEKIPGARPTDSSMPGVNPGLPEEHTVVSKS